MISNITRPGLIVLTEKIKFINIGGLDCNISLSFCSFLYNGVCYDVLKLSVSDVIVSQKGSNGETK